MSLSYPNQAFISDRDSARDTGMNQTEQTRAEAKIRRLTEELVRHIEGLTAVLPPARQGSLQSERQALFRQLSDSLNHELRNPLAVIRVSSHVLRKGLESGESCVLYALERIERSVMRCDRILEELLDFTRITDIEPESTSPDPWLAGVLAERAPPDHVALYRKFGLPTAKVTFDRERLRRAVINVFENACQAMMGEGVQDSPVRERLLTVRTGESDGRIEIVVEDDGPGIPPDVLPNIFEPLFSTKGFGLGLGLTVARQIMELHGGGIEIETEEGRGTRVCLWLPLAATSPACGASWRPAPAPAAPGP